ncbi:DNA mismatch repair protein [Catonella morbi ATCC 51271]|uniref:DNA mismatch repair protein MutL n=1 Tax=Catonella morbi ATCC 51271 TaxID=592026 RepID=V2Y8N9_9FIRM|nr:DNA mismatch repair endonuclease MutL [Catonella morbi]ESL04472.1 DNA mismatch repair protein [Catonella morbi ATCC 51271]
MAIINLLDKDTINKIAAGEVIEGPAAVVKELVENAIDADANSVTVEIKDGGTSLIRVTDNGKGIGSDDIKTAFLPHATSKIKTADDLVLVSSLGFRGEALASIAAVSEVEVLTKTADEISGIRYVINGGKEEANEPIGTPEGTTFVVRNIFYNTPARKKFLKTAATEGRYVGEVMEHMAVSHPEIAFKFILNGQVKLQTMGNGSLKDVLFYIYGKETTANIIPVNNPDAEGELVNGLSVRGYIGKPSLTRGNKEYENYFINGRFIKNKVITRAIEDAYKSFLMQHRFPFTCLLISVDSSLVDVNVHPAKLEVRFSDTESLYRLIFHEVDNALRKKDLLPDMGVKQVPDKQPLVREFKSVSKSEKTEGYVIPDIPMPEPFEKSRQGEWKKELKPVFMQESFVAEKVKRDEASPLIKSEVYAPLVSNPAADVNSSELNKILENKNEISFDNLDEDKKSNAANVNSTFVEDDKKTAGNEHIESVEEEGTAYKKISDYNEEETAINIKTTTVEPGSETDNELSSEDFKGGILAKKALPDIKIIGQIFGTYWIMEFDGSVYMIDQHAAHEKVMYEKFVKEISANKVTSQNLLPPVVVTLSGSQRQIVEEISNYLHKLGFEIEPFGGNEYVIKAVPTELFGISEKEMFFDIIDQYSLEGKKATPDTVLSKLATMACKAAIKGNMNISLLEVKALIEELMSLDNPYNCPHGRPTMIFMSKSDVEKKFKRQI